jgi:hypothetical protein
VAGASSRLSLSIRTGVERTCRWSSRSTHGRGTAARRALRLAIRAAGRRTRGAGRGRARRLHRPPGHARRQSFRVDVTCPPTSFPNTKGGQGQRLALWIGAPHRHDDPQPRRNRNDASPRVRSRSTLVLTLENGHACALEGRVVPMVHPDGPGEQVLSRTDALPQVGQRGIEGQGRCRLN